MNTILNTLTEAAWAAIGGNPSAIDAVSFIGTGGLPSAYPVTDFASAVVATAGLAIIELLGTRGVRARASVDRRLASLWFGFSIRPMGWRPPPPWDPIAGDYATSDGWLRLHTNAPHHRAVAQRVLGPHADKEAMARAVAGWKKTELEKAIVEAGGCAAEMRTTDEWLRHPQGAAVTAEPLVHLAAPNSAPTPQWEIPHPRPLEGIKVLDLTRVLAGPVAGRFLAGYGAEVLRIDPPDWDEPSVVPEVTLGKRCARLNMCNSEHREIFRTLLSKADILLHGYRPGALDNLGFDPATRRSLSPGLIDVCLCAYGWSGPWAARRGFDSLVQMSIGIADTGMRWRQAKQPVPLPVQALDQATGYLMAAACIRGVTRRLVDRTGTEARLSLARTAKLLVDAGTVNNSVPLAPETAADLSPELEATEWGDARRLNPPVTIDGAPMHWRYPARDLGSAAPDWNPDGDRAAQPRGTTNGRGNAAPGPSRVWNLIFKSLAPLAMRTSQTPFPCGRLRASAHRLRYASPGLNFPFPCFVLSCASSTTPMEENSMAASSKPSSSPLDRIRGVVPKLADLTEKVLFGDVWERPGLSKRDRSLITCAALVALQRPDQLRGHLQRALTNGVTKDELSELITHLAFYSGWPTAVTAAAIAKEVFDKQS